MTAEKIDVGLKELEFSRIPSVAECWRRVLSQGRRMKFAKGTHISSYGADAGTLYYLERGEIWLTRSTMDGREKIIWAIGPDSLFGETPFFDELPARSAMVAAVDCTVYAFARQCVLSQILPAHPDLMLALFKSLALKVRVLSNQAVSLSLDDLPSRICKYLHLRQKDDISEKAPLVVSPGLNQQDLANLLGVHRVTLNKSLRELEKSGVLGPYSRDEVYILDRKRFNELVRQNE
ncbi:MAG TPA: Crp/Fnr family transcriptional regulator [Desulfomicrobium sp.]|nr:Crp/Fnr family transcriptional regulator [Desulfomicrobium sp.]